MWRLRTFGGLAIEDGDDRPRAAARRRPLALLVLLAVAGQRGMRREKVVSLLWPESDEERARNSLSQVLATLRRDLSSDDVLLGSGELRLNPALLSSDVADFEAAVAADDAERAVELYQGPFLDGFFVSNAAAFEDWASEQRSRLQQKYANTLRRVARRAEERKDFGAAVASWQRLAAVDPAGGDVALGLMTALVAAGNRAGALQHYRVHQGLLREEFGVEPDPAVQALAAALQKNSPATVPPVRALPNEEPIEVTAPVHIPAHIAVPPDVPGPLATPGRLRRRTLWLIAGSMVLIAGTAALMVQQRNTPSTIDPRRVVVTAFSNRTGDATLDVFGLLAADVITDGLQRANVVEVADPATMLTVSKEGDLSRTNDDPGTLRQLATMNRAQFIVTGYFSREGDSIAVVARVADARGRVLGSTEPVNTSMDALGALERVRERVNGILATHLDERLRDVLTPGATPPPTLRAYREHHAGLLAFQQQQDSVAREHFRRAHTLDSTFIAPLIWKAIALGRPPMNPQQAPEQAHVIQQIARRRADLTALDRHVLEFLEAQQRSDVDGSIAAIRQASDLAPGSFWTYWLAESLITAGRFDEGLATYEQIDRTYGWTHQYPRFWQSFVEALSRVDHDRELEIAREARLVIPTLLNPLYFEARALGAMRRWPEFWRVVNEMRTFPDPNHRLGNLLHVLGMALWTEAIFSEKPHGDTLQANELVAEAIAWFAALPPSVSQGFTLRNQRASALMNGNRCDEARPILEQLVEERPREYRAHHVLGVCFARLGESARAEEVIDLLVARSDSAPWNYMWSAGIAAALGDQARAVSYLKKVRDRGYPLFRRFIFKYFDAMKDYAPFRAITVPMG